jgi:hypothetical protein
MVAGQRPQGSSLTMRMNKNQDLNSETTVNSYYFQDGAKRGRP